IQQLKNNIIAQSHTRHLRRLIFRYAAVAAIVAIIITSGIFLLIANRHGQFNGTQSTVMVQTAPGERATTFLPDGTSVAMNYDSYLIWDETSFNQTSRNVRFEGEGFFNVSKNTALPFEIHSGQLTVTVTGTSFNLRWRANRNVAQLYLISGSVKLTSDMTGESVNVKPGQLARFDCETGQFSCDDQPEDGLDQARWRDNELVFNASPLSLVITELSGCYGTQIMASPEVDTDILFTGTLPGGDLLEAMHTLEVTFGVVAQLHGGTVELIPM
ncbi:MAG: FecR domain-containing protein, partial [Muribaculaceae bacterium]|nr:FecR domain-containing protein [Muribaculaceae bacterium]